MARTVPIRPPKRPSPRPISVELVVVHVANDGTKTLETKFVDADGTFGHQLEVLPGGRLRLVPEDEVLEAD